MNLWYFLFPKTIKLPDSKYNRNISVNLYGSQPTLFVDGLIESGNILTHIWKVGLRRLIPRHFHPQHILLLGLGGGSNAELVSTLYPHAQITAVEIDPYMETIARKYFGLSKIKNLRVIICDALDYINSLSKESHYDLILVDCFVGKYIPDKFATLDFVKQCFDHSDYTLINRIFWREHHPKTIEVMQNLSRHFFFVKTHTWSNVVICPIQYARHNIFNKV